MLALAVSGVPLLGGVDGKPGGDLGVVGGGGLGWVGGGVGALGELGGEGV